MFSLLTTLIAVPLMGAPVKGQLQLQYRNDQSVQYNSENIKATASRLGAQVNVNSSLILGLGYEDQKRNFSGRELIGSNGERIPLTQFDSGRLQTWDFSFSKTFLDWQFAASVSQGDSETGIFKVASESVGVTKYFYNQAASLSYSFQNNRNQFATGYFIDPRDLVSRPRRNQTREQVQDIYWEQILTDRSRGGVRVVRKTVEGYRPTATTFELSGAYALASRWALHSQVATASESQNEQLTDDRGYFQADWVGLGVVFEPWYDHEIFLRWTTLMEKETDPRRQSKAELGTDLVELEYLKAQGQFQPKFTVQYAKTSQGEAALRTHGGILWLFD